MVYKLVNLTDQNLQDQIRVEFAKGEDREKYTYYNGSIRYRYFQFWDAYSKMNKASNLTLYVDGSYISSPLRSDSIIYYNLKAKAIYGVYDHNGKADFVVEKRGLTDHIPLQILFKRYAGFIYMVIMHPGSENVSDTPGSLLNWF